MALDAATLAHDSSIKLGENPLQYTVNLSYSGADTDADFHILHVLQDGDQTPTEATKENAFTQAPTHSIGRTSSGGQVLFFVIESVAAGENAVLSNVVKVDIPDAWEDISPGSATWSNINVVP